MTDSRLLLQGLKEYHSSLKKHMKHTQNNFRDLQNRWHILRQVYYGEGADQLQLHWKQTVEKIEDYLTSTVRISVFLDERIESLTFYERNDVLLGLSKAFLNPEKSSYAADTESNADSDKTLAVVLLSTYLAVLGGEHRSQYHRTREKFLRNLINDPNQPKWIRGMIKTKLFQNPSYFRGIPGYDVGHFIPGIDLPENYRLELSSVNRARPNIAKKTGVSNRWR